MINKTAALNVVKALPVVEFNGVEMCSKKRILRALTFLPAKTFATKLRKNLNSEIFCQNCENIIKENEIAARRYTYCPHCGLKIVDFRF